MDGQTGRIPEKQNITEAIIQLKNLKRQHLTNKEEIKDGEINKRDLIKASDKIPDYSVP